LDAHPHVTLSHEFDVFSQWKSEPTLKHKEVLFTSLYKTSVRQAWEAMQAIQMYDKRRLCDAMFAIVPQQWQGRCNDYVEIIGDKKADITALRLESNPEIIEEMKSNLQVPLMFIYPIRHPLDMISTQVLRDSKAYLEYSHTGKVYNRTTMLLSYVKRFERRVANVHHWMESKWLDTLVVHNDDLISDPKSTLEKICAFLKISCTGDYIGNCTKVVFGTQSRTRDNVYWPSHVKQALLTTVKHYSFLARYQHDF
jgi:hypothetical protein